MLSLSLQNKKAVVCGSTQGIGKAIAIELSDLGAEVVLVARNETALQATLADLPTPYQQKHSYLVADFGNYEQLQTVITNFVATQNEVHILINNTGGPAAGLAIDAEITAYVKAFEQHLVCNQILVKNLVPLMKKSQYGRIVNIISTSVKQPLPNLGVSNTIRGAVANWAKTLSVELAPFGITVNNVLPGATKTQRLEAIVNNKAQKTGHSTTEVSQEMIAEIPARRFGEAQEVAAAAVFLCTPAAAYINGINLPVDGGRTACL
jgi:3-oxoacyl-[acyl-carrier protein] reductase